jgi:hypothetical protein
MNQRQSKFAALARVPPGRIIFFVVVAAWAVRAFFLSVPNPLSIDEVSALAGGEYGTAARFVATSDWAERWDVANHFRQWHILWIALHSAWGYLFASDGQTAYALTVVAALVAMLATAGSARHLYGERGYQLALLITSVSPLCLNYTVRVLGAMPATMFLSLALFFFTSERPRVWRWIAGGFCMGTAFGISFGAGAVIVALAAGLGLSIVRALLDTEVARKKKIWRCGVAPIMGMIAALVPLAPIELSARHAGAPYSDFLLHHTMLVLGAWPGPYGLWLRELFELDPLLQVLVFVTMAYALRAATLDPRPKSLLGAAGVAMVALLFFSLDQAPPRVFVSLGLFALAACAVFFSRILERECPTAGVEDDPKTEALAVEAPFDYRSLVVGILILAVVLTASRNLSNMTRLVFPAWPLFILALIGLLLRTFVNRYTAVVRVIAVLGSVLFLVGAGATFHAKSAHSRARAYAAQRPYMRQLIYENFWDADSAARSYGGLSTRARYDVAVFGPPAELYPASAYEEDPYKILLFRNNLAAFGLGRILTGEEIIWASIFYEDGRAESDRPPPGIPDAPEDARGLDAAGNPFIPRVHPHRGVEMRFPARDSGGPAEMSMTIALPAELEKEGAIGFEFMAFTPYVPAGTRLIISAFQGERQLGSMPIAIAGSEGRQADASLPLYEIPRQKSDPFRLVRWPIRPNSKIEKIRIVARLEIPSGQFSPPVSCYIRRPYIDRQ